MEEFKMNTVEKYNARLQAMKEEMDGITPEIKATRATEAKRKKDAAYSKAYWEHMYTGLPENALREGSDGSGGYLVPDEYDVKLVEALYENNILRGISTIKHTDHDLKITRTEDGGSAQWVDESHAYPNSDLTFGQITLKAYKLGTKILVSDELLEDSGIDLEAYIKKRFGEDMGRTEEEAFLTGDGVGKPTGLIYQAQLGTETAEAGKVCIDDVIDLVYSLKQPYRHGKNTAFIMSEKVYQTLRKTRTASGRLIWNSNIKADGYDTLFGYRVYLSNHLDSTEPGFSLSTYPILFGDFSFFWIGDRGKRIIKRLTERYADYGQVGFIATQRVDGKLVRPEAIKVLKVKEAV